MKVNDVLNYLEKRFPYDLAEDFDKGKIGLTIGDKNSQVMGILCSLDLTEEVVKEAIQKKCNLIITHHPFIFQPLTKVLVDTEKGSVIFEMIKNNISLISMHTNMDLGYDGVADTLAKAYHLKNSNIGINEKECFVRIGEIDEISLFDLATLTKKIFGLSGVRVVGKKNTLIKKIGILGGSGGIEKEIINASNQGCDCYITGEIKHNIALTAKYYNICLIEVNHGIEKKVFEKLIIDLKQHFNFSSVYYASFDTDLFYFC